MSSAYAAPARTDLLAAYEARLAAGQLRKDAAQARILGRLQAMVDRLAAPPSSGGLLARLGLRRSSAQANAPGGLYIWGPVGRGKSMLMDLFFEAAPVERKRRVHFHEFMIEVHERLHRRRQSLIEKGAPPEADPIPPFARAIAAETRLLCFDEFQVTNIADAMILGRLFATLFDEGVAVVATSNRAPDDLYRNGLQRDRFLPFIELLKSKVEVAVLAGDQDYRLARLRDISVYVSPLGAMADDKLAAAFARLTDDATGERRVLKTQGREVVMPRWAQGVAWFTFEELCARPLGAADYIAIAEHCHTVIVQDIPKLTANRRNEAMRFVTLIDELYEHKVKLICSAAAIPQALYPEGDGSFEFERTVSRLLEMQSHDYLAQHHVD
ncbi:MAG: cell division protein ZapE [Reyranellaceae bacterium]